LVIAPCRNMELFCLFSEFVKQAFSKKLELKQKIGKRKTQAPCVLGSHGGLPRGPAKSAPPPPSPSGTRRPTTSQRPSRMSPARPTQKASPTPAARMRAWALSQRHLRAWGSLVSPVPTFLSIAVCPPSDTNCHPSLSRSHPRRQAPAAPTDLSSTCTTIEVRPPLLLLAPPPSPSLVEPAPRARGLVLWPGRRSGAAPLTPLLVRPWRAGLAGALARLSPPA
jgi:hypothetical protein